MLFSRLCYNERISPCQVVRLSSGDVEEVTVVHTKGRIPGGGIRGELELLV